jgi:hypothetical protein
MEWMKNLLTPGARAGANETRPLKSMAAMPKERKVAGGRAVATPQPEEPASAGTLAVLSALLVWWIFPIFCLVHLVALLVVLGLHGDDPAYSADCMNQEKWAILLPTLMHHGATICVGAYDKYESWVRSKNPPPPEPTEAQLQAQRARPFSWSDCCLDNVCLNALVWMYFIRFVAGLWALIGTLAMALNQSSECKQSRAWNCMIAFAFAILVAVGLSVLLCCGACFCHRPKPQEQPPLPAHDRV